MKKLSREMIATHNGPFVPRATIVLVKGFDKVLEDLNKDPESNEYKDANRIVSNITPTLRTIANANKSTSLTICFFTKDISSLRNSGILPGNVATINFDENDEQNRASIEFEGKTIKVQVFKPNLISNISPKDGKEEIWRDFVSKL